MDTQPDTTGIAVIPATATIMSALIVRTTALVNYALPRRDIGTAAHKIIQYRTDLSL